MSEQVQQYKLVEVLDDKQVTMQITYDYYKQQREEMSRLANERSSLTIQLLIIAGALAAIFFQAQGTLSKPLLLLIGISVVAIGALGYILNIQIEKSSRSHMLRARAARRALGFLEQFAEQADGWGSVHHYYFFLNILAVLMGILFIILTLS